MSIFKCKMCGGTIEFEPEATVGVCDSCGTKQTLPRLDDDRRVNLYDRANHFRRNNEFDKAAGIYEQILNEDTSDAEAYWSLVLCRYGIEYVEDPAAHKRVPTVNRAQFTSIFDDDNYRSALNYADEYQRAIYEEEAAAINEIQKGILAISQKEEPFDVFICYKETDHNGRRSHDSVLANDLYHQLTQEGFKVFFSRITLEDKLGTAYEPYIFAALNSSKVMVVLGTKPEHFSAVWVRNEWSRYLSLVKQSNGRKVLIPAYRDMDPYDLPEEFSHLQALDMSKLGFMQDLIRGIKKIIKSDEPKEPAREAASFNTAVNVNTAALIRRVFMSLEDGEWLKADDFCEQILNLEPENARAYLGKLMAELHVSRQMDLADCEEPFNNSNNFKRAIQFADDQLSSLLNGYIIHINERKAAEAEELRKMAKLVAYTLRYNGKIRDEISPEEYLEMAHKRVSYLSDLLDTFDQSNADISRLREKIRSIEVKTAQLDARRSSLGLFSGKKKKSINNELTSLALDKQDMEETVKALTNRLGRYAQKSAIEQDLTEAIANAEDMEETFELVRSAGEAFTIREAIDLYLSDRQLADAVNKHYPAAPYKTAYDTGVRTISFGSYPQDRNGNSRPIEWEIIGSSGSSLLLVSRYALDSQPFNESLADTSWESCSLRKWLNETFAGKAFSADEWKMVQPTIIPADQRNLKNDTTDEVFLLSEEDVNVLFKTDKERECSLTPYAAAQAGIDNGYSEEGRVAGWWWLRSAGSNSYYAAGVNTDGSVCHKGCRVDGSYYDNNYADYRYLINIGVRPAIWINIGA